MVGQIDFGFGTENDDPWGHNKVAVGCVICPVSPCSGPTSEDFPSALRRRNPANDAQWDWDVTWNVLTIITTWLKIPAESLAYHIRQGGLVSSIVHVLGKEALLLPAVWELVLQADSMLSSSWCNHP